MTNKTTKSNRYTILLSDKEKQILNDLSEIYNINIAQFMRNHFTETYLRLKHNVPKEAIKVSENQDSMFFSIDGGEKMFNVSKGE